jgi:Asp-tRNA(Asn)/Glu-tRNA(Gln) amidotransferase A subunit family amidase
VHLAESFDTLGWIFRDLRDGPVLAAALFGIHVPEWTGQRVRIACVDTEFMRDCENGVTDVFRDWQDRLREAGAEIVSFDSQFWEEAMDIFAPIQANEAAAIHAAATGGDFSHFESSIAERLRWGASIDPAEMKDLRRRHAAFRERMYLLLREYDFLIAPCAPVTRLLAGADNTGSRRQILRYTTPLSLCGSPVVTLPDASGTGVQLAAARGGDARLVAFAAWLGAN